MPDAVACCVLRVDRVSNTQHVTRTQRDVLFFSESFIRSVEQDVYRLRKDGTAFARYLILGIFWRRRTEIVHDSPGARRSLATAAVVRGRHGSSDIRSGTTPSQHAGLLSPGARRLVRIRD